MPFRIRQQRFQHSYCPPSQPSAQQSQTAQQQPQAVQQPQASQQQPQAEQPQAEQQQPQTQTQPQAAQESQATQQQTEATQPQQTQTAQQPQEWAQISQDAHDAAPAQKTGSEEPGSGLLQGLSGWLKGPDKTGGDKTDDPAGQKTGDPAAQAEKKEDPASQGGATEFIKGLLQKALPPIPLNDEEQKQVAQATETLKKLAGADGRWDGKDLRNNLNQMKGSLRQKVDERISQEFNQRTQGRTRIGTAIKRGIGQRVLDKNYGGYVQQGMGIARQTAMNGMVEGQDKMGVKRPEDYNKQANAWDPKSKSISAEEMEQFGATMKMIEAKAKAMGYPPQKFENGLPVKFLEMVRDGKLPVGVR